MTPQIEPDWSRLEEEFEVWKQEDRVLPLWWRDDDAIAPTTELETLSLLSEKMGLPVHLAIIPKFAQQTLADTLDDTFIPVVHGWSHENHAPSGEKKMEFGEHRALETLLNDANTGLERLQNLFGGKVQPMFVPPWNRISPAITQKLASLGYHAISTFTPRKHALAAHNLSQVNTHLDLIDWRCGRSLVAPQILVDQLTCDLQDRRFGKTDATEPYGILTHHLVHDPSIWWFTETLVERLLAGPGHPWHFTHAHAAP